MGKSNKQQNRLKRKMITLTTDTQSDAYICIYICLYLNIFTKKTITTLSQTQIGFHLKQNKTNTF